MSLLSVVVAWFHIFFAIAWIGSAVFFAFVLTPVLSSLSQGARGEFFGKAIPRVEKFEIIVSTMTIAFGAPLPFILSEQSIFIKVGAGLGILTWLFGIAVMAPLSKQLVSAINGQASGQVAVEISRVSKKFGIASFVDLVLMLMTFSAMVAAGFL
ncbi:MAG: hypothetical protein QXX17_02135 [Conexivisphaerales archaeon]